MAENEKTQIETNGCRVFLSFFEAANPGKSIFLENASVKLAAPGMKEPLTKDVQGDKPGPQYIHLSKSEKASLTSGQRHKGEGVTVDISLIGQQEIGCTSYVGSSVSFTFTKTGACCCIPLPLQQVQEACRIRFSAYDCNSTDFVENAKSFLNGVSWSVTAVHSPAPGSYAPGSTTGSSAALTSHHASSFQAFTATATSVEGNAEIAEVPLHQLYRIETRGPEGYLSQRPSVEYRYICCEPVVHIKSRFCPCGDKPKRSVIFVQEKCLGMRWLGGKVATGQGQHAAKGKVSIGGDEIEIDENGIMNVPEDMDGIFPVSWPGYAFSPAALDLRKGASPVSTIAVSDQTGAASGIRVRGQFVDDSNVPFVHRPVSVLLPNGDEIEVFTDEQGYFEVPRGSRVRAMKHAQGLETEIIEAIE